MGKNKLNILITAGGTSENIDSVRRISNSGTGRLGALAAESFAAALAAKSSVGSPTVGEYAGQVKGLKIVYICSEGAALPMGAHWSSPGHCDPGRGSGEAVPSRLGAISSRLEVIIANDVSAVESAIRTVCAETSFDAVIHSMAISDYVVKAVSDSARMTQGVMERLSLLACGDSSSPEEAIQGVILSPPALPESETSSKISSDKEDLIIVLEKAPKLIAMLRGLAKDAVIVGFKLLTGASEDELVEAGSALLKKNDCNYVLANDMKTVMSDSHEGLLIGRDGAYERATGKAAIADLIVKSVLSILLKEN
jgi:phosphopantothenate-cysteine ligase